MARPKMKSVSSSLISKIGYDIVTNKLYVEFSNKAVYSYENVTPEIFSELEQADSIGEYFTRNIKKKPDDHPYNRE